MVSRFTTPIFIAFVTAVMFGVMIVSFKAPQQPVLPQSGEKKGPPGSPATTHSSQISVGVKSTSPIGCMRLVRATTLLCNLRNSAIQNTDMQTFCIAEADAFQELRTLGVAGVTTLLCDEIADKTSPAALRMMLIEMEAEYGGRKKPRLGQILLAIIGDSSDVKSVRMQALQWLPQTGAPSAGSDLVRMLPRQTDPDLEFGVTRALRGFKVPGSVKVLESELAEDKGHLIRIAALHAIAAQGGQDALAILQNAVGENATVTVGEDQTEEIAVAVHEVLALGEIPDTSSLPVLERILTDSGVAVSVRSKTAESIATIGGAVARKILTGALLDETNESVLVYIAHGLLRCNDPTLADVCLARAASVRDSYAKSELLRVGRELQESNK